MKLFAWSLFASFVLAATAWALEDADVRKRIADLESKDPKVQAAALAELTPLIVDLNMGVQMVSRDKSREVVAALRELRQQLNDKMDQMLGKKNPGSAVMAANETAAAACCKAYAEAQEIYHRTDYQRKGVLQYAQALKGDDSLLETKAGTGDLALIDKSFANAEGPPSKKPTPKAGYCFKILTKQGPEAVGGARDYIANGCMTLGYALVAYPAKYGETGRDCFIINNNGTIFQKDLGPETPALIEKMIEFNPDKTWTPAE